MTAVDEQFNAVHKLAAILILHHPQDRWLPYPDAGFSYDTRKAAAEWDDDTVPTMFLICAECGRIEMSNTDDMADERSYDLAIWPCATARAFGMDETSQIL